MQKSIPNFKFIISHRIGAKINKYIFIYAKRDAEGYDRDDSKKIDKNKINIVSKNIEKKIKATPPRMQNIKNLI